MKKNLDNNLNLKKARKYASIIAGILGITIAVTLGLTLTYPWTINSKNNSSNSSNYSDQQVLKKKDSLGFISKPSSNNEGWNSTGSSTFYFPMVLTNQTAISLSKSQEPIYKSLDTSYQYYLFNSTGTNLTNSNFKFIYEGLNPNSNYYSYATSEPTTAQQSQMLTWLQQNVVMDVEPVNSENIQVINLYIPTTSVLPNLDVSAESFNSNISSNIWYNLFFNSGFALSLSNQNITNKVFQNTSLLFSFAYCDPSDIVYFGNSTPSNVTSSSSAAYETSNTYLLQSSSINTVYSYNSLQFNVQNVTFSTPTTTTIVKLIPSLTPSQYYLNGYITPNSSSLSSLGYEIKSISYVTENNLTNETLSSNDLSFDATNVNWNNNAKFSGITTIQASPYISANITIVNTSSNETVTFSEIIEIINTTNYF